MIFSREVMHRAVPCTGGEHTAIIDESDGTDHGSGARSADSPSP